MAKANTVRLGDYVVTSAHNHTGRVYMIHNIFAETGEDDAWFRMQKPALPESARRERWVSILCHEGGAVQVPESDVKIVGKFDFNNPHDGSYFRD